MLFWPLRFALRLIWRLRLIVVAALAGFVTGLLLIVRSEQQTWGVRPQDVDRALAGDELIPVADVSETRSLAVAAPPEAIWPWLVQMGYGRGGWYSYDQLDMDRPSADSVFDEWQGLAEGDLVPTHPDGGFVARIVEPETALVLYLDTALVAGGSDPASPGPRTGVPIEAEARTPGPLQAAGALGDLAMPEFRATWAFILEPQADGSTRLIERLRLWTGEAGLTQQLGLPLMGLGVFLMTRKHMLGVKERAERLARQRER